MTTPMSMSWTVLASEAHATTEGMETALVLLAVISLAVVAAFFGRSRHSHPGQPQISAATPDETRRGGPDSQVEGSPDDDWLPRTRQGPARPEAGTIAADDARPLDTLLGARGGGRAPVWAALASCCAGILHGVAAPAHFESLPTAAFFVTAAALQLTLGLRLASRPASPLCAVLGFTGSAWVAAVWLLSRTTGLPVGSSPATIGLLDTAATGCELVVAAVLLTTLRRQQAQSPAPVSPCVGPAPTATLVLPAQAAHDVGPRTLGDHAQAATHADRLRPAAGAEADPPVSIRIPAHVPIPAGRR